jgi:hypothetical protein
MSEQNKVTINDNEAVRLFLNFYKLLFLGSPFAEKMLNIKIEENTKANKGDKSNMKTLEMNEEDEETKSDSASFIIDTSDISSSGAEGLGAEKTSPSSNDSLTSSGDPYSKIKNHAVLCL